MSMDSELLELMPSTVTVADLSSVDAYGEAVFGTATSYRARIEPKPTLIRNFQGEEVVASATIYLACTTAVSATAEVTLPDGSTPPLQQVAHHYETDGTIHHVVLYVGGG